MKQKNRSLNLKRLVFIITNLVIILIFSCEVLFSQISAKDYKLGAILLSKEEFEKLPKTDWEALRKQSNISALAESTTSIKMLVTPSIGNQGGEGSCVGWATGYTALGILTYPKYTCWDIASRSPEYVFNQIKQGSNCTTGAYIQDGLNLVSNQGSCSWNMMPYTDLGCSTLPNSTQIYEASKHNSTSWSAVSPNSVTQIKQALDLGLPVVIGFAVYQSFYDMWNSGGIWTTPNYGTYFGGHAVCIVGYDDTQQMFKIQNQWGLGGAQGFFWVTYNLVTTNIFNEAYILSGMNPLYPETISGSKLVCSTGNTFVLNYLPSGCTILWNKSANLTLSSAYGNTAIFTANGSGSGWVEATIQPTACSLSSFTIPRYDIDWVGTPSVSVTGPDEGYPNVQYTFQAHTVNPTYTYPFSYTWDMYPYNGYISTSQGGNYAAYAYITFYAPYSAAGYRVMARAQNACGTGAYGETRIWIHDYWLLSPNPASETVTVTKKVTETNIESNIEDLNTIYTIRIIDLYGVLHYTTTKSGQYFTMPVSNLKDGNYIIQITDGNNTTNLQLVVKH